jgi:hypothetical protein
MRLRCNQKEVLKLHTLWRRAFRQVNTLTLPEKECDSITQFHTCEMNANT